ncbi:hypothetical protein F8S09_13555 [Deinococcus sp. SDU3-2]|uniref:Uncharacterized protein n=1 Tax=Deinococcus terrestris TaxID=2651870 RepID=A0A7X1NXL3_9DEIO|nr:hypothetical protein [Deinococcus terrestris]MPY67695.1 hypothetical protein [Deinococcus terrestris]
MTRVSIIHHPPRSRFVTLREEFLAITGGDACAAKLLHVFEHWTNYLLGSGEQARKRNEAAAKEGLPADQDDSLWIYKSFPELVDELLGDHKRDKVIASMRLLVGQAGFLQERHNPKFKWDRRLQYLLCAEAVNTEIRRWSAEGEAYVPRWQDAGERAHRRDSDDATPEEPTMQDSASTIVDFPTMEDREVDDESSRNRRAILQDTPQDTETGHGSSADEPPKTPRKRRGSSAKTPGDARASKVAPPGEHARLFAALSTALYDSPTPLKKNASRIGQHASQLLAMEPPLLAEEAERLLAAMDPFVRKNVSINNVADKIAEERGKKRGGIDRINAESIRKAEELRAQTTGPLPFKTADEFLAHLQAQRQQGVQ